MDFEMESHQRILELERKVEFLLQELGLEGKVNAYESRANRSALSPEILTLVRQGRKIEAIKLYREKTGASLMEAKAAIDKLG